ncbi:sulfur carrier protein ThiS [Undibacterium sp. CY18W]|uniref:Sulfur carrier protein ThiS n=1 Tax=Undibacterium hunanense TaxID=2762292 RepID=A0ABR6ZNW0_9BURK|nr:sulfur carrier protein ThiS [Undibacterium hunanense]MBC3917567.1 sulfur carrier protein ThiS [Undibacterium hunanense]
MVDIQLNGEKRQLASALLADLIAELNLSQQAIAVAVNRQIIPKSQWAAHHLQIDDKVDVVRAIGGG